MKIEICLFMRKMRDLNDFEYGMIVRATSDGFANNIGFSQTTGPRVFKELQTLSGKRNSGNIRRCQSLRPHRC